jgi:hypothetical protein
MFSPKSTKFTLSNQAGPTRHEIKLAAQLRYGGAKWRYQLVPLSAQTWTREANHELNEAPQGCGRNVRRANHRWFCLPYRARDAYGYTNA